jgi:protein-L-isoaspartate(D-aspartate) O-methyltransferase
MNGESGKSARRRAEMVEHQLRRRGIRDERVLAVMADLPRELFLPADHQHASYDDGAQPIGLGQTISQPYIVGLMTDALDVRPSHRVLEIGSGSGYQTAILARLAKWVYGVERLEELAARAAVTLAALGDANVTLRVGDGSLGWPEQAPFDRILCGAGSPDVPPSWAEQLVDGGKIVLPIGPQDRQQLIRIDKASGKLTRTVLCEVRFVPLIGEQGWT